MAELSKCDIPFHHSACPGHQPGDCPPNCFCDKHYAMDEEEFPIKDGDCICGYCYLCDNRPSHVWANYIQNTVRNLVDDTNKNKCIDELKTKRLYVINMSEDFVLRFDDKDICTGAICGIEALQGWAEVFIVGKTKQQIEDLLDGKDMSVLK